MKENEITYNNESKFELKSEFGEGFDKAFINIAQELAVLSKDNSFNKFIYEECLKEFDGDNNVLLKTIVQKYSANNERLSDSLLLSQGQLELFDYTITTSDGDVFYPHVYIPNIEEVDINSNVTSIAYYGDEFDEGLGYSLEGNEIVEELISEDDLNFPNPDYFWVVALNERVNNEGYVIQEGGLGNVKFTNPGECGNGQCEDDETQTSCPQDCSYVCGDGVCDSAAGENLSNCLVDCDGSPTGNPDEAVCGDGYCDSFLGEDGSNCPDDCCDIVYMYNVNLTEIILYERKESNFAGDLEIRYSVVAYNDGSFYGSTELPSIDCFHEQLFVQDFEKDNIYDLYCDPTAVSIPMTLDIELVSEWNTCLYNNLAILVYEYDATTTKKGIVPPGAAVFDYTDDNPPQDKYLTSNPVIEGSDVFENANRTASWWKDSKGNDIDAVGFAQIELQYKTKGTSHNADCNSNRHMPFGMYKIEKWGNGNIAIWDRYFEDNNGEGYDWGEKISSGSGPSHDNKYLHSSNDGIDFNLTMTGQ